MDYIVVVCEKCNNEIEVPDEVYWDSHCIICKCGHCNITEEIF